MKYDTAYIFVKRYSLFYLHFLQIIRHQEAAHLGIVALAPAARLH